MFHQEATQTGRPVITQLLAQLKAQFNIELDKTKLKLYCDAKALRPGVHLMPIRAKTPSQTRVVAIIPTHARLRLTVP